MKITKHEILPKSTQHEIRGGRWGQSREDGGVNPEETVGWIQKRNLRGRWGTFRGDGGINLEGTVG